MTGLVRVVRAHMQSKVTHNQKLQQDKKTERDAPTLSENGEPIIHLGRNSKNKILNMLVAEFCIIQRGVILIL